MRVRGVLILDGWTGRTDTPVVIVGETPKRFRITPPGDAAVKLAGCSRWLQPGQVASVPKTAIRVCKHEESLYGRCVACGMTWEQQASVRSTEDSDG